MPVSHDSETPAEGQQVITVTAFIHKKDNDIDKVLLAKRANTKKFLPGLYEMPGGHVDFGEDVISAVIREVKEEFSVDVTVGDPFACFTYVNKVKGSHSVEIVYFARLAEPEDRIKIDPEDHSEYDWFSREEVDTIVRNNRQLGRRQASVDKTSDEDAEIKCILKGFSILEGHQPDLG